MTDKPLTDGDIWDISKCSCFDSDDCQFSICEYGKKVSVCSNDEFIPLERVQSALHGLLNDTPEYKFRERIRRWIQLEAKL